jgi:hypothetical protein
MWHTLRSRRPRRKFWRKQNGHLKPFQITKVLWLLITQITKFTNKMNLCHEIMYHNHVNLYNLWLRMTLSPLLHMWNNMKLLLDGKDWVQVLLIMTNQDQNLVLYKVTFSSLNVNDGVIGYQMSCETRGISLVNTILIHIVNMLLSM